MSTFSIVRQPIFDRQRELLGYEVRFRDTEDGRRAFDQAFLSGTFDTLRAGKRAFIACSREQIVERAFLATDPATIALLVPNDIGADADVLDALSELRRAGGTIALDELGEDQHPFEPLLELADWVRLDVSHANPATLADILERVTLSSARCIADHVTESAQCEVALDLGFSGFEGLYFSRPEPLPANDIPSSSITALRSLALARDERVSDHELEVVIATDPVLTFQILRLVNSAAIGARGVESIGQALRLIGRHAFLQWLSVAIAASRRSKNGVDQHLVRQAVERGRFLEQMAGRGRDSGTLFLVGMFSLLDGVFRVPLADIVGRVALGAEAKAALMDRVGPYADALAFADAHSLGLLESATELATGMGIDATRLPEMYASAVAWTNTALNGVGAETASAPGR